jgi:UDP-3-O-acyl N-acetylglucosamine deacetylase
LAESHFAARRLQSGFHADLRLLIPILVAKQRTLKQECRFSGIALHTGIRAHLTLKPAAADSGYIVRRVDLPGSPEIRAIADNVIDVRRATTLANGDAVVHTVEHVLAALYACGVDNAYIDLDGAEPPIADGSSEPFVRLIDSVGTVAQSTTRQVCEITHPIHVEMGDTTTIILPDPKYRISCTISFGEHVLYTQFCSMPITKQTFTKDLAKARTFCPDYYEIESLMLAGLIRGASLDNAMVFKDGAIICKDGLRYPDECVRHKTLDIVGDLSLVGCRVQGHVVAVRPGHPSNVALAQRIREEMELT